MSQENRCPRCGDAFRCGVNDAAPCACTAFKLDAQTLARLRESHHDCLCLRCLAEFEEHQQKAGPV